MKKIRPIKNTWYDWLINYSPESIRKSAGGFKEKIFSLFETNTPKQTEYGRAQKLSKPKTQNLRNPFILKRKKKKKIIRDIWKLFETEEVKKERNKLEKKD